MYTFGMLGSYVSQGVYAVAGPLQGAVDIIVVKQDDGTFKSSPWYVKCGDSQGSRQEAKVEISVNNVKTDLYMLMNRKGDTFFENEVEDATETIEDSDGSQSVGPEESNTTQESVWSEPETGLLSGESSSADRLEETSAASELGAPLNETSADSKSGAPLIVSSSSAASGGFNETSAVYTWETSRLKSEIVEENSQVQDITHLQSDLSGKLVLSSSSSSLSSSSSDESRETSAVDMWEAANLKTEMVQETSQAQGVIPLVSDVSGILSASLSSSPSDQSKEARALDTRERNGSISENNKEELPCPVILNLDTSNLSSSSFLLLSSADASSSMVENDETKEKDIHLKNEDRDTNVLDNSALENIRVSMSSDSIIASYTRLPDLIDICSTESEEKVTNISCSNTSQVTGAVKTDLLEVPSIGPQVNFMAVGELVDTCGHLDGPNVVVAENWFSIHKTEVPESDHALRSGSSSIASDAKVNGDTASGVAVARNAGEQNKSEVHDISTNGAIQMEEAGSLTETERNTGKQMNHNSPPQSRWNMWPLSFRRSRSSRIPVPGTDAKNEALLASTKVATGKPSTEGQKRHKHLQKRKVRSYVPTSNQIESLQLKEGANKVTFTFPGRTKVDAYIYLWKWNARIVISDVDGTITKSDVLGQVMPLVGRDWSQYGVTRLFSAIKENGYEVLFLSARAISQAYLTRRFLGTLKQDGEALPEGPIFISPDGLLPSLYREVIRRTPHEFKIACLEEIRRLFPRDVNPFYAGFGNRHTDELSYRKVGIPKGKIFIINPKGEIMVNQHHHIKTYTSIHKLVDGMFPPVSRSEQEDFNSWNYWKLPLPNIGDELSPNGSKGKTTSNRKK